MVKLLFLTMVLLTVGPLSMRWFLFSTRKSRWGTWSVRLYAESDESEDWRSWGRKAEVCGFHAIEWLLNSELNLNIFKFLLGEFDCGSERTLAACLIHASRTRKFFGMSTVAHGWVTRRYLPFSGVQHRETGANTACGGNSKGGFGYR